MLWWVCGIMAQTIAKASSVGACAILFPTFCRPLPFSMLDEMFGNTIRHWVWVHVLHFPLTGFHVNSYVYMAMQRMCLRAFVFDDWFMSYLLRTLSAIGLWRRTVLRCPSCRWRFTLAAFTRCRLPTLLLLQKLCAPRGSECILYTSQHVAHTEEYSFLYEQRHMFTLHEVLVHVGWAEPGPRSSNAHFCKAKLHFTDFSVVFLMRGSKL